MFKIKLLVITITSLLSASASSNQSNDSDVPPKSPVDVTCKTSPHINTSKPLIDFENPILDHKKPFLLNGALSCDVILMRKQNVKYYNEVGTFQRFDYKVGLTRGYIHLSSSPKTSKWKITCKKDDMEDTVTCSMNKHNKTPLFVHLDSDGETTSFGLLSETYPNMEIAVKVGNHSKIAATSMGELLSKSEITEQMKTSDKIITSYYSWPYKLKKVETHGIEGFNAGVTLMKKLFKESKFD